MMPFTFRHLEPNTDLSPLVRLYVAVESADHDGRDTSEARLREQLGRPGHNPRLDCWVVESAEAPNELIGFSGVWKDPNGESADIVGLVHPAWRRRGIGRVLLSQIQMRARALGAASINVYGNSRTRAPIAFLRDHRFQPVGTHTLMRAPGNIPVGAPAWPAGFNVRSYAAVQQAPLLADAMTRCYDGLWGHHAVTEADLAKWLPEWTMDGIFLAFDSGGEVAGVCRAEPSRRLSTQRGEPTGYIDAPGVLPWRRDHGLYLPLLLTALQYLRAQRLAAIEMESWGDDERNLELYLQVGFDVARQAVLYRLNLR
ncbi:MAG: hypothetical protein PVSMB4_14730 [Ktedonobacterales bacterium]